MWSTFEPPVSAHGSSPIFSRFLVVCSCDVTSAGLTAESDCASVAGQAQIRPCTTRPNITLPRRYACQKSMRREMRSARPFTVNNSGIDARNGQAYHGRKTTTTNGTRPAAAGSRSRKGRRAQWQRRRCATPCVRSRAGAAGCRESFESELKQRYRGGFNETKAVKVAVYARYSSDNQRDASIADQLRVCREFAARQGWRLRGVHDHAISGATLLRPGFQALMRDALNDDSTRARRVARSLQPRPGRHRRPIQAPDVRRRSHRHARRGRHHAPAHRFQGDDERAVSERPRARRHNAGCADESRRESRGAASATGIAWSDRSTAQLATGEREIEPAEARSWCGSSGVRVRRLSEGDRKALKRGGCPGPVADGVPCTIHGNAGAAPAS